MEVTVHLPGVLRTEAQGQSSVRVPADGDSTLGSVLDRIGERWPLLERRIRDERGELRRYVNVYIDGEECRWLAGVHTAVNERSEILVVPSVAGG